RRERTFSRARRHRQKSIQRKVESTLEAVGGNNASQTLSRIFAARYSRSLRRGTRGRRKGSAIRAHQRDRRQEGGIHAGGRQTESGRLHLQSMSVREGVRAATRRPRQRVREKGRRLLRRRSE